MTKKRVDIVVTEKGANKAARGLKRVDGAMGAMAKSAALYAGAMFGVGGVIRGLKSAVEAAGFQEQQEKKLEVALGGVNKALLAQASALQQATTFGDEMIIGVQASIAAFVDDEEAIKRATAATLDMAAATGMDLKAAGDLVAKSLGSSTNALSRYGIEVTGAVGSSERLDTLTKNIADKFGGQAAAAAETMAGKIQQSKNALGDLAEQFGSVLAPAITLAATELTDFISGYDQIIGTITNESELQKLKDRWNTIQETLEKIRKNPLLWVGVDPKELEEEQLRLGIIIDKLDRLNTIEDEIKEKRDARTESIMRQAGAIEYLNIKLKEEVDIVNDLRTDFQKWTDSGADVFIKNLTDNLGQALVYGQNFGDAMVSSLKAIAAEIIANAALYAILAAINPAGAVAGMGFKSFMSKQIFGFATGGDFVTNGPQLIMVGDNPGGRERVRVDPIGSPNINGSGGGVTLNFYGDFMGDEEIVERKLIPAINRVVSQGRGNIA